MTIENGKLVQKQSWDGKETNIEREVTDGKLIAVSFLNNRILTGRPTVHQLLYIFALTFHVGLPLFI